MKLLTSTWSGTSLAQSRILNRQSQRFSTSSFLLQQRVLSSHSAGSRRSGHQIFAFPHLRQEEPPIWGENSAWPKQTPGFSLRIVPGSARAFGSRPSGPKGSKMPPALGSASFYPIQGFFYLWQSEGRNLLLERVAKFAGEVVGASGVVLAVLTGLTFRWQRSVLLRVVPQWFGTPGTIIVILIETAVPVGLLFHQRLRRAQSKIFDEVLNLQNIQVEKCTPDEREWIDEQREIQWQEAQQTREPRTPLGVIQNPNALNDHPVRKYFLTLPMNFIPVVGSVAFCWMNAVDTSATLHHHYYRDLKGLSEEEESTMIQWRKKQYQQFGVMASALTLVPGMNAVLVLTNAIGAALWAAEIEKALQKQKQKKTPR